MRRILKGSISLVFSSNRDRPRGRRPSGHSSHAAESARTASSSSSSPPPSLVRATSAAAIILSFPCVAIRPPKEGTEVRCNKGYIPTSTYLARYHTVPVLSYALSSHAPLSVPLRSGEREILAAFFSHRLTFILDYQRKANSSNGHNYRPMAYKN